MRKFLINDAESTFSLKKQALEEIKKLEYIIHQYFAVVQNDGVIITEDDIRNLSTLCDEVVNTYDKIDDFMASVAEKATSIEIKDE